ncbi:Hsp20 family protein [Aliiroseovarius sp. PTFE2010]|uniref:Hsp20 family protein n=1 Tax=Aliiroseovarius sp. PTFE2010 TaxID=3417190 RepID=UPI003CF63CBC
MRNFDMTPFYRSTVGFDQIADLMDRVLAGEPTQSNYPPYNIEKLGEDSWRISIAVAGFADEDLTVETRENALVITGRKADADADRTYLHRGIATRAFERRFHMAEHVHVTGAAHENGMLHIDLVREVPEALKPRTIAITASKPAAVEASVVEKADA